MLCNTVNIFWYCSAAAGQKVIRNGSETNCETAAAARSKNALVTDTTRRDVSKLEKSSSQNRSQRSLRLLFDIMTTMNESVAQR